MIRGPPRSTLDRSSAASDVYKRQGRIVQLTKEAATVETPIRKELRHFIKIISGIAIALGIVFFVLSVLLGSPLLGSLIFAIGIIVANVPEGLLPTVTLALTLSLIHISEPTRPY